VGKYDLNRLNNSEFENLVQALSVKMFNYESIIFGAGPDGAREATFEGACTLPNQGTTNGYHVVQAKFKECFTKLDKQNWNWAKNEFAKEMDKFKSIQRGLKTPDVYVFFTNIQFTSVHKTGGRDKIENFKKGYISLIPKIIIYGYDDICAFLDTNRDVATTYSSFILSGDILQELYSSIQIQNKKDQQILYRYLSKEFEEDLYSKLEQANELTDQKINLDKVFVDLNILGDNLGEEDNVKFVSHCINLGNNTFKDKQFKMVFIGGPGQGKSTVTQYLAQIYRAYFLSVSKINLSQNVKSFLKNHIDADKQPKCYRFPIRIVLSDYAEWLNREKNKGLSSSVLSYIQYRIQYRADENFSNFGDFRVMLEKLSFLFIFDGLDEVPATSNRNEVIIEISEFINFELHTIHCDALVIATTRPQGYSNEFDKKHYTHFTLGDLDSETCFEYLKKLLSNTLDSGDERTRQLKILKEALDTEVTSNIMRTPLQATIMSILVKSGGKPSKDKFSLFNDYYITMVKREKQKNVFKIISEHEEYINEIHYRLANRLQLISQKEENSSSYLNINDFKVLVEDYFIEQGLQEADKVKYTNEIMDAIIDRLVFIVEKEDSKIGFAIRSTQEYFSAMMNVHNQSDENVIMNIKTIAESIYWRNVFIFMIGYIAKNKVYFLSNIDSYLSELNGSTLEFRELSSSKISNYGTQLALEILSESILASRPNEENKFIKHLKNIVNIIVPQDTDHFFRRLSQKIVSKELFEILEEGLKGELSSRMSCWKIIADISHQHKFIFDKLSHYWPEDEEEELYCLQLFLDNQIFSEFILERFSKYIDWKHYDKLRMQLYKTNLVVALSELKILQDNVTIKNVFIEYLFISIINSNYLSTMYSKVLYKLLNIKFDLPLNDLIIDKSLLMSSGTHEVRIYKIKNLQTNKMIIQLKKVTSENKELFLLSAFFSYCLEPSMETLKEFLSAIQKKESTIDGEFLYGSLGVNWQLNYIGDQLKSGVLELDILNTMAKWGSNYQDFLQYEKELYDINKIEKNLDYLELIYDHKTIPTIKDIEDYYNKFCITMSLQSSYNLLLLFIFMFENKELNINDSKINKEIIGKIVEIINNDRTDSYFKSMAFTLIIGLLKPKEFVELKVDLSKIDIENIHLFINRESIHSAIKNLLTLIKYDNQNSDYIRLLLDLKDDQKMNPDDEKNNYNIFFDLQFDNSEIQTYCYLLSLIDPLIHNDSNKVKKIINFCIDQAISNEFKHEKFISFIRNNKLSNELIQNFLSEMYKHIKQDSLENCLLAANYQNTLKMIFENKLINL